jgi:hypothetical protein
MDSQHWLGVNQSCPYGTPNGDHRFVDSELFVDPGEVDSSGAFRHLQSRCYFPG